MKTKHITTISLQTYKFIDCTVRIECDEDTATKIMQFVANLKSEIDNQNDDQKPS